MVSRFCLVAFAALQLRSAPVRAQGTPPDDVVRVADQLFADAMKARAAGDRDGACALFAQSLAKNSQAIGTILNVARCDEEAGRVATASRRFAEVRDRARELDLEEYRKTAADRIAALAPRVPHLALAFVVPPSGETTIEVQGVRSDERSVADLQVDPGPVAIVVSAPRRQPFTTHVVMTEGQRLAIAIPALRPASSGGHPTLGAGLALGGIGLLGASAIVGLVARHRYDEPLHNTDPTNEVGTCMPGDPPVCDQRGHEHMQAAQRLGTIGTVIAVVGLASTAVGTVLWLRAPSRHHDGGVAIIPSVDASSASVIATGRF